MARWYNYTIECNCCGTPTSKVLTDIKPIQKANENLASMFGKVGLTSKCGKWTQISEIYGSTNKLAFEVFQKRAYDHVKKELKGKCVPKPVFMAMVNQNRKDRMDTAFRLRIQYYMNIKKISDLWKERVIDEAVDGEEGRMQCAHCGSQDVRILDCFKHTNHLGITKDDIKNEFKTYGFRDQYSSLRDCDIDIEMYQYYDSPEMYDNIKRDELEDEFYDLASNYPIEVVCRKLGANKCFDLAELISEYYSCKMFR
jgi:hypothetical protein